MKPADRKEDIKEVSEESSEELISSIAIIYLLIPGFSTVQVYKINNIIN